MTSSSSCVKLEPLDQWNAGPLSPNLMPGVPINRSHLDPGTSRSSAAVASSSSMSQCRSSQPNSLANHAATPYDRLDQNGRVYDKFTPFRADDDDMDTSPLETVVDDPGNQQGYAISLLSPESDGGGDQRHHRNQRLQDSAMHRPVDSQDPHITPPTHINHNHPYHPQRLPPTTAGEHRQISRQNKLARLDNNANENSTCNFDNLVSKSLYSLLINK